ncbi:hypothetical protein HKT30_01670 [Pseudomonas aeruginosa]|nr:hypothetical protein [Pseudomonas aeruginosa]
MTNELTDVRCPCGAEFQADSYDAGFIAGSGMCQNCDAAMPPKDIPAPAEQAEAERPELWAVHAQGPDELYAAFTREGAEKHAADLNALPMPEGIAVGAVVVPSPWPEAEHWKYLAEQERDHKNEIAVRLRQFERICEGLPQDAIDGGWTVQGIRAHSKQLEEQLKVAQAEVEALRAELQSQRERNTELIFKLGSATNGWGRCEKERDAALARVSGLRSLLNPILCYVENDIERMRGDRDKSDNKEIYDLAISLAMERLKAAQHAVFTTEPGCDTAVELASHITAQAQHSVPEGWRIERSAERIVGALRARNEKLEADAGALEWLRSTFKVHKAIVEQAGCGTIEQLAEQRDAALARVAELEKQEPVATVAKVPGEDWNSLDFHRELQDMHPGTKLYAAPVAQAQPEETPGEILAAKLIETWVTKHGKPAPWSTAVEITALATNMPNDERDRLLALDDDVDAQAQHSVPRAWLDVQAERRRQVEVEGYHVFRDSHYISYELSKAARAYIEVSWHALSGGLPCKQPESWPWMAGFTWSDGRTMLVKACALTLAEIERLDRAAAPGKEVGHE